MALKVVSMNELKLEVLLEAERTGETIAEVCRRRGISRASFCRLRRRYLAEGAAGLKPRAQADELARTDRPCARGRIVELRRRHPRWGGRRIHGELACAGIDPPAVVTIHRALGRNRLVAPQPPRQRKARKHVERAP